MREAEITESGAVIGGRSISNLQYADDTALCGKSPQEINNTVHKVNQIICTKEVKFGWVLSSSLKGWTKRLHHQFKFNLYLDDKPDLDYNRDKNHTTRFNMLYINIIIKNVLLFFNTLYDVHTICMIPVYMYIQYALYRWYCVPILSNHLSCHSGRCLNTNWRHSTRLPFLL